MEILKMYRPLVSKRVSQHFGENKACTTGSKIVSTNRDGCPAGSTPFYKSIGMNGHNGLDFPAVVGEEVFHCAMYEGWMQNEVDRSGGIGVNIISNEPVKLNNGQEVYLKTKYWHLKAPVGHDDKQVKFGQTIGLAGSTGASSAPHLHFGIKTCDKYGNMLDPGNGYYGAFDPEPYMEESLDANEAADMLNIPAPCMSTQERKEMLQHISGLRVIVLYLLKVINRMT